MVTAQGGLSTHGIPPPSDDTQRLLKSLQAEQAVFNSKSMLVEAQLRQLHLNLHSSRVRFGIVEWMSQCAHADTTVLNLYQPSRI